MTTSPSGLALRLDARGTVTRRRFLGGVAGGPPGVAGGLLAGLAGSRPLPALADEMRRQGRSCILLWMAGGPSQFETFDPKPGAETQGPTRAIATAAPAIRIAEHWPRTA